MYEMQINIHYTRHEKCDDGDSRTYVVPQRVGVDGSPMHKYVLNITLEQQTEAESI